MQNMYIKNRDRVRYNTPSHVRIIKLNNIAMNECMLEKNALNLIFSLMSAHYWPHKVTFIRLFGNWVEAHECSSHYMQVNQIHLFKTSNDINIYYMNFI